MKKKMSKYQCMKVCIYEPTKQILELEVDRLNRPLSCTSFVSCVNDEIQTVGEQLPIGGVGICDVVRTDDIDTLSGDVFKGIVSRSIVVPCRSEANVNNLIIGLLNKNTKRDFARVVKEERFAFVQSGACTCVFNADVDRCSVLAGGRGRETGLVTLTVCEAKGRP